MKPRIFVSIASYRDPECQHTVKDLFDQADDPSRISVGICWQFDPEFDAPCFEVDSPCLLQTRQLRYHVQHSKGCCWARAQALSLWQGEEYILQIDAHMRFVPGWDTLLIDAHQRCPTPRAVLSTIPPAYLPPRQLQDTAGAVPVTYVCKLGNENELQPVWLSGWLRRAERVGNQPLLNAFICGNFLFAPAQVFQEIPFDPHIYFRGQEPVYSARLWTHGWDIYQPDKVIIYHYWESPPPKGGSQPAYKSAPAEAWLARQRVLHLLGVKPAEDARALIDIEKYGMGLVRPLAEFWEFSDINLKTGVIGHKAAQCQWKPHLSSGDGVAMTPRHFDGN